MKKQLVELYPDYKDAFVREISKGSSWILRVVEHINRCWVKPSDVSSAWNASVSMKISKELFLHSKKINHCDGSNEFCHSVDKAIDRCIGRKLPKPDKPRVYDTDIMIRFNG